MVGECVFCKISKGEIPKERIYENDSFFSFLDIHPLTEGHSQVISKKHFSNILEMPNTLGAEFLDCVKNTALIVIKENNAEGFNLVSNTGDVAGQIVKHIHVHIIPRKKDDGVKIVK